MGRCRGILIRVWDRTRVEVELRLLAEMERVSPGERLRAGRRAELEDIPLAQSDALGRQRRDVRALHAVAVAKSLEVVPALSAATRGVSVSTQRQH